MLERQLARMQRQPPDQRLLVLATFVAAFEIGESQQQFRIAIKRIVENRRARRGEMHPKLMRSTGERTAFDKSNRRRCEPASVPRRRGAIRFAPPRNRSSVRNSVTQSLPPRPLKTRMRPGCRSSSPSATSTVKLSGSAPAASRIGAMTFIACSAGSTIDERVIFFLHRLRLKLPRQKIERRLRLRTEQQPTRIGIEPVHIRDRVTVTRMRVHESHQVLALFVPAIGSDEQPARFVECDERIVFKNDRSEALAGNLQTEIPQCPNNLHLQLHRVILFGRFPREKCGN